MFSCRVEPAGRARLGLVSVAKVLCSLSIAGTTPSLSQATPHVRASLYIGPSALRSSASLPWPAGRMHQRTGSSSTRIAIPPSPKSKDGRPVRAGNSNTGQHEGANSSRARGWFSADRSSSNSLSSGLGYRNASKAGRGTAGVRLSRRQVAMLLASAFALYILVLRPSSLLSSSGTASSAQQPPRPRTKYTPSGDPVVERKILNKLREIEVQAGYADADLVEAREADRLPYRAGSDGLAPLYDLPDAKKQAKAKASAAVDAAEAEEAARLAARVPASELDALYCSSQLGDASAPGSAEPERRGCKFLFAAWIGEQETKAQQHLYQLGLLAVALDRILVLPQVSKSRMMSCAAQPFSFYYSPSALRDLGIPTISFEELQEWSSLRDPAPSAQIITITNSRPDSVKGAVEVDPALDPTVVPSSPKRKLCLDPSRSYLNFSAFSPVAAYPPQQWYKTQETRLGFGESLINTLNSSDIIRKSSRDTSTLQNKRLFFASSTSPKAGAVQSPDVLVINYELRYPILSPTVVQDRLPSRPAAAALQPFSHFPYSPAWTSLATQLSTRLSPFIAVHWRQETLPPDIISPCGDALVARLVELTTLHPEIRTVYLATDYPLEDLQNGRDGVTAHSGTFGRLLTEEHHTAMARFLRSFTKSLLEERGVRLTSFAGEQEHLEVPAEAPSSSAPQGPAPDGSTRRVGVAPASSPSVNLADLDAGLHGIIDKTVAMQAQIFVTGQPWSTSGKNGGTVDTACAKDSSFTKQIYEARRARRKSQGVENSGLWSE